MLLTPRDAEIIRLVARHRFLRSTHIISLAGGSPQQLLRRMQLLFHHGYLERPRAQLEYFYRGGSKAMVYGLGKKGAAMLQSKPTPERQPPRRNPSSGGRIFLDHALMVADVMVAIELACRSHGGIRLLTGDGIPLPAKSKTRIEPFHWSVQLADRTKLGVIPDSVFVLEFGDQPNERDRILYFLEADRATMPVERPNLARSSFRRKLVAYEATWAQSLHQSRFGFHRFRVVTVTTSAARVASLAAACGQLSRGRGLFLFTDIGSLSGRPDLLTLPFQSGHAGKVATLLD